MKWIKIYFVALLVIGLLSMAMHVVFHKEIFWKSFVLGTTIISLTITLAHWFHTRGENE